MCSEEGHVSIRIRYCAIELGICCAILSHSRRFDRRDPYHSNAGTTSASKARDCCNKCPLEGGTCRHKSDPASVCFHRAIYVPVVAITVVPLFSRQPNDPRHVDSRMHFNSKNTYRSTFVLKASCCGAGKRGRHLSIHRRTVFVLGVDSIAERQVAGARFFFWEVAHFERAESRSAWRAHAWLSRGVLKVVPITEIRPRCPALQEFALESALRRRLGDHWLQMSRQSRYRRPPTKLAELSSGLARNLGEVLLGASMGRTNTARHQSPSRANCRRWAAAC